MNEAEEVKKGNPLGYEPIGKLLRQFAMPAVIAMLVNAVYNIVDQIFIGQGVNYLGNGATTVCFPIVTVILAIGTLLGAGGSAYSAIRLGEKKDKEAEKALGTVFTLLVVSGIVITAAGLIFLEPILKMLGATPLNMSYAKDYASVILWGATFNLLGIGLSNFARTDGAPKLSMYSMLIGAVLNTILDPIYIFVFHWGVKGAAVATITSQLISAVILTHYFMRRGKMRLRKSTMIPRAPLAGRIAGLGISSCITQLGAAVMQVIMNKSLVTYGNRTAVTGDVALSAMGVVMKISMILVSICVGIGIGAQPILGFNCGAGQMDRVKKTYLKSAVAATIVSIVGLLLCQMIPGLLMGLFGKENADFTSFGIRCLRIYMLGIFCAGFQIVSTNYFQATGQPLKASVLSMLRQLLLLIPLLLILPLFFGLDGILYAGPIADITSGIIVSFFIVHEMKKLSFSK